MNAYQEDILSMFNKVRLYLNTNIATIVTSLPIMSTARGEYETYLDALMQSIAIATDDITGYTENKAQKRKALETIMLKIARALTGYSVVNNIPELKKKVDYVKSEIEKMRDSDLYASAKRLEELTSPYQNNLSIFGVDATDVTLLNQKCGDYWVVIQLPKEKIEARAAYNQLVNKQMSELQAFLRERLDVFMSVLEFYNETLYIQYKSARSIDISGGGSSSKTYTGTVSPNATQIVLQTLYNQDRTFSMENKGTTTLTFALSEDGITEVGTSVSLSPGDIIVRDTGDLAASGTYFIVTNQGNDVGDYQVVADK